MINPKMALICLLTVITTIHPVSASHRSQAMELEPEETHTVVVKSETKERHNITLEPVETAGSGTPNESTETTERSDATEETETNDIETIDLVPITDEVYIDEPTPTPKTVYNMTTKELNALSIKQKAKLVGISVKEFNMMAEVISHEAGLKMKDKICVAAVIWNRKYCKQFRNSIKGVINEPGQFYDLSKDKSGNHKDKKAQLAILLAYKQVHQGKIPHNVLYFNSIGFGSKNRKRYTKYKHYNNYFLKDSYCHCKWCK